VAFSVASVFSPFLSLVYVAGWNDGWLYVLALG
jgi:hypothetical protein